jgi:hypothetical protein
MSCISKSGRPAQQGSRQIPVGPLPAIDDRAESAQAETTGGSSPQWLVLRLPAAEAGHRRSVPAKPGPPRVRCERLLCGASAA